MPERRKGYGHPSEAEKLVPAEEPEQKERTGRNGGGAGGAHRQGAARSGGQHPGGRLSHPLRQCSHPGDPYSSAEKIRIQERTTAGPAGQAVVLFCAFSSPTKKAGQAPGPFSFLTQFPPGRLSSPPKPADGFPG